MRTDAPICLVPQLNATLIARHKTIFEQEKGVGTFFSYQPDVYDVTRDTTRSLALGTGQKFCAGAAASRALVAGVALPALFERFPCLRLSGDVEIAGWAFRGP